jgi:hypothetical protein
MRLLITLILALAALTTRAAECTSYTVQADEFAPRSDYTVGFYDLSALTHAEVTFAAVVAKWVALSCGRRIPAIVASLR